MDNDRKELGKISVRKRALNIDELEDKVRFAVDAYKRAFEKYKKGADSLKDWSIVIRALSTQVEEIRDYIAIAHHNTGVIYASKDNFSPAIESLKTALEYNPEYAVAHNNLSIIYRKIGDIENAEKHLEEAKRLGFEPKKK